MTLMQLFRTLWQKFVAWLWADAITSRSRIGGYVIEKPLAAGGMGDLYEAQHSTLGRRAVLKLNRENSADRRAMFLGEARATAAVSHPNVVTVFDYGQAPDGRLYYAMEWVEARRWNPSSR
jgi:serine/threonine protein kinase